MIVRVIGVELAEAGRFIRRDRQTWWSMIFVTTSSTLMLVLAMLAPRYVVAEIGIQPEDAVFLVAPAGLGILLMSLVMARLARRFGEIRLSIAGGMLAGTAVVGLGVLPRLSGLLAKGVASTIGLMVPLDGPQELIPGLMIISAGIGMGVALTNIPAQSVLMDRAPIASRGRIFAVLLMLGNVAAIAPLAFLGVLADAYGVPTIVSIVGFSILVIAVLAMRAGVAADPNGPSGRVRTT
jgi:MFS family permease